MQALAQKCTKCSIKRLLQFLTTFLYQGITLITCVTQFQMRKTHSVYNGTETLSRLGPKIWSLVTQEIRQSVSLDDLNQKSKNALHSIVPED